MIWLDLIGGNSGAFYLDIHSCEIRPPSGQFPCSMTGILGDGTWESPVLVELGKDISITLLGDDWDGLRPSTDGPEIDINRIEKAIRDAFDAQAGPWRYAPDRQLSGIPHLSGRRGSSAKSYPIFEESPSPKVREHSGTSKTAA